MKSGERIFAGLLKIDQRLAAAGIPPISDRWKDDLRAFYGCGALVHGGRMGRASAKSTNAAKCLVAEVLCGEWLVPPGERHWAINISENLGEATARLGQIATYLDVLSIPYTRSGEQIVLEELPLGFWSRAARIGALSGPRVVAWSVDEAAKLNVEGVNPAGELVASLKAASATHPGARGRVYSSPWGTAGFHYDLIEAGTKPGLFVSQGPTWEYNPSISEARTHEIEPDPIIWAREYAAIPGATDSRFLDPVAVARAVRKNICDLPRPPSFVRCYAAADLGFSRNSSTLAIGWIECTSRTAPRLVVGKVREWKPLPGRPLNPAALFREMASDCSAYGVREVLSDAWSYEANKELARQAGLRLVQQEAEDRADMYQRLARHVRLDTLSLPDDPIVVRDLSSLRLHLTPDGNAKVHPPKQTADGRHADTAPAVALVALQADRGPIVPTLTDAELDLAVAVYGREVWCGVCGEVGCGPRCPGRTGIERECAMAWYREEHGLLHDGPRVTNEMIFPF